LQQRKIKKKLWKSNYKIQKIRENQTMLRTDCIFRIIKPHCRTT